MFPGVAVDFVALAIDAAAMLLYALGWIACLGLLYTWNSTFHYIFKWIADVLTFTVHIPGLYRHTFSLGGWATDIDTVARNALSDAAKTCDQAMGKLFYIYGWIVYETVTEIQHLAQDTLAMGHWLAHKVVPTYVHTITHPVVTVQKVGQAALSYLYGQVGVIDKRLGFLDRELHHLERASSDVIHLPRSVVWPQFRKAFHEIALWRHVTNIRLRRLERLLAASGLAVAVANMLGLPNWRCLTKGPIARVSRALCGLPSNFLNDLLGLLADVWIVENICTLIPLLETAASDIGTPLIEALTPVGAGLCHGVTKPSPLPSPPLDLPPVYFGTAVVGV